jgi:hypothetical protein
MKIPETSWDVVMGGISGVHADRRRVVKREWLIIK